ncbi:unnamed protein product, partial [Ectocarpus sp. 8 AP-2014]
LWSALCAIRRVLSLPSQLVPAKPGLPPEVAMAAALSRPRCGFLVWCCCWVLVGAAAASRRSSTSTSTSGGLAFHLHSAPWARAGGSRDTSSSGRGRGTAALEELSGTGVDRRKAAVARRSRTETTTGMSVSLQPRRYYPRWGQQDDGAPASPLTYRQSPDQ